MRASQTIRNLVIESSDFSSVGRKVGQSAFTQIVIIWLCQRKVGLNRVKAENNEQSIAVASLLSLNSGHFT